MSQTDAPQINMTRGFNGAAADSHNPKDVLTGKAVKEAMPLGLLAVVDQANGDGAVMLPTATGDITNLTAGVVLHSHAIESSASGDPQYPQNAAVNVLRKGRVYVEVEDAVDEGAAVFARHTADFGKFRSDIDGGDATLVPGAVFRSSTTGAGLAVVEINLP